MILNHFSKEPIRFDRAMSYHQCGFGSPFEKPSGLWLSDESDYGWREWCKESDFNLDGFAHEYEVDVDVDKVLVIPSLIDLDVFNERYEMPVDFHRHAIDWGRVMHDYKGVIITPYQWDRRLNFQWYYGWDCASGCLWDLTAVRSIRKVLP